MSQNKTNQFWHHWDSDQKCVSVCLSGHRSVITKLINISPSPTISAFSSRGIRRWIRVWLWIWSIADNLAIHPYRAHRSLSEGLWICVSFLSESEPVKYGLSLIPLVRKKWRQSRSGSRAECKVAPWEITRPFANAIDFPMLPSNALSIPLKI